MEDRERHLLGMKTWRAVLGDAHVEASTKRTTAFTAEFQDLTTRLAWGEIWARSSLDRRTRRLLAIAMLIALGREKELDTHLRAALASGVSPDLLKEVLLQSAVYCGVPAANGAFNLASGILADMGLDGSPNP